MKKFDLSKAAIIISSSATVCESAARILRDEIAARTRLRLKVAEAPPAANVPAIVLGTVGDLPGGPYSRPNGPRVPSRAEGYAIWIDRKTREAPTVCLAGRDDRGTLFAAGRLLRLMVMARDRLTLAGDTRIASAPRYPLRGHQLAYRPKTNSYDGWTVPMWEQYMRDLVVFGANAVELLPPHTDDEPDSPLFPLPPMEMMIEMSRAAERYGLDVWVWYPIMAGLDSLGGGIRGGKCIDDTKEVHRYLKEWEDVFRQLPRLNAVLVPGGDPGDRQGAKPFMAFVEKAAGVLRRHHPDAQMWVSVQAREHRLKAFLDTVRKRPDWLDGIVRGPGCPLSPAALRRAIPKRYPIRLYPDITHSLCCQHPVPDWDVAYQLTEHREPINPRPAGFARIFRKAAPHSCGFITYSEGCNDDVNKVVWSCLGWDPKAKVQDILHEYGKYFISDRFAKRFGRGLAALEENWQGPLLANESVYGTLRHFQAMERSATPREKLSWRFQMALYRAYYDAYVQARLIHETRLEKEAVRALRSAPQTGSVAAIDRADAILKRAVTHRPRPEWRARIFEIAEGLFQSIRMQLSVERYHAIGIPRGANLDLVDVPVISDEKGIGYYHHQETIGDPYHARIRTDHRWKKRLDELRGLKSEKQRLGGISKIVSSFRPAE